MPNGATSQKSPTLLTFSKRRKKKMRTYLLEDNDNGNDITTATLANVNDDDRHKKEASYVRKRILFFLE